MKVLKYALQGGDLKTETYRIRVDGRKRRSSSTRDRGVAGEGGEGARTPRYFQNYKELVRKIVLCPPNIESLIPPSPQSQSCSAVPEYDDIMPRF